MINLLLGNGIHNRKLPSVNNITKKILDLPADSYEEFRPTPAQIKREEIRNKFRKLLKLIYNRINKYYYGYKITPNYEDIFYVLTQIMEDAHGYKYNPIINDFRTNLFRELGFKKDVFESDKVFYEIRNLIEGPELNLMSEVKRILKKSLDGINYSDDDIKINFFFIQEIIEHFYIKHNKKINIFSLNHDLIFENFFNTHSIKYHDGFSKTSRNISDDEFYLKGYEFNFNLLRKSNKINLIKLHGSLDWYHNIEKGPFDLQGPINDFIYKRCENSPQSVTELELSSMVVGTYNKTESYLDYIYIDLFNFFNEELNKSNLLICSGYGFQDSGINRYIIYWMSKNKNSKLLIIHPNIPKLLKGERRDSFFEFSKKLINEGRIITLEVKFGSARLNSEVKESKQTIKKIIEESN